MPEANWTAAKLYAPHVAAVLSQLQALDPEPPTAAAAQLLVRSAAYAEHVLCDFRQALG